MTTTSSHRMPDQRDACPAQKIAFCKHCDNRIINLKSIAGSLKFFQGVMLFFLFHIQVSAQVVLPRSTPEAEGISSKAISTFLDSIAVSKHEFHSFMLVRHGKVVAEGWWNPYQRDLKHTMYSLSKSFTATAIGFARAEGKLALSDKVISFFPDMLPDSVSPYLQQLTVKDLLTMSVGHAIDPTGMVVQDTNWVKRFLALPIRNQPGTSFLYNSAATYMLSAIVQKTTGQKMIDYLRPRLFEPLGITGIDWETDPKGVNTGGWGLRLKTEDIAKFAQLFLQKGIWQGKQLLPAGWAEEASMAHIIQNPELPQAQRDFSDWQQGYGYQMWRSRNGAYRGDGAFGQYALVMPKQDAVIAITSETPDMQGELNLIWNILLPAMKDGKLKKDKKASSQLKQKLSALALAPRRSVAADSSTTQVNGKTFVLEGNDMGIKAMGFQFDKDVCRLELKTESTSHSLLFGNDRWQAGETTMRGPYLVSAARNNLRNLEPFKISGSFAWIDGRTLSLTLRYIESPHTQTFICRFDGNKILVEVKRSFDYNKFGTAKTLKGVME